MNILLSEFGQIEGHDTFDLQMARKLTHENKKEGLSLITTKRERRCGKIKGKECAGCRKQRRYISKDEVASPIIQLESLLVSLIADENEGSNVKTADIAGAYLLANMKDHILIKLSVKTLKVMCEVNIKYESIVASENGKRVLYLKLKNYNTALCNHKY